MRVAATANVIDGRLPYVAAPLPYNADAASRLELAFAAQSPRFNAHPTSLAGVAIYLGVLVFWIALTSAAFVADGFFSWSIGVVYVAYDTFLIGFVVVAIAGLARPQQTTKPATGERPSIAIIVAAWNEAHTLRATIDALLRQTDRADLVVIADDGSDDTTAAVMASAFDMRAPSIGDATATPDASLVWLRLPHAGKANALNAALARISTDIVVTVDADTILAPDAMAVIRNAFASDETLVVGGGVLRPVCAKTSAGQALEFFQRYEYIRNFMSRYAWSRLDALLLISGAFAAFRREPVMRVGGFDPQSLVEDYELIHRLQRYAREHRLRWRVRILGRACARTGAPSDMPSFLRQRRRWFGGFLQTQFWHRDMTGQARFGALGLAMLPVKSIDTLQPLYGLTALAILPVFVVTGRATLVAPALGIMTGKILLDLVFYLVCIALYRRWTGDRTTPGGPWAVLAAVLEPWTFQPLRHLGAALGWVVALRRDRDWGRGRAG